MIKYNYCGRDYYFSIDQENNNFILIEKPLKTDSSISEVKRIRVYDHNDKLLKLNNESVSSRGGSFGLYETIIEATETGFLTELVEMFIEWAFM